jgi:hypothetical protein
VSLALLIAACGETPPSAYRHSRDQLLAAVPAAVFDQDLHPCFRTVAGEPSRLTDEDCYRFGKPQRRSGVWANGFEEGRFYPNVSAQPSPEARTDFWLEMKPGAIPASQKPQVSLKMKATRYVRLDFIGRQTAVPGAYGHMGMAKHLIIVDRVLQAKALN